MDTEYKNWIQSIKLKIASAQIKASIAVNEQMIILYWEIGKSIVEKQEQYSWGTKVVEEMAKDLKRELPGISGFSRTNLFSMRKFFSFYKDSSIVHQAAGLLQNTEKQESIIVQQAAGLICYDNILNNIYFKPKYN